MKHAVKICVWVLLLLLPAVARGDTEAAPYSYAVTTPGGKYVFVMLAPERFAGEVLYLKDAAGRPSDIIPVEYPASGLYPNDGSTEPLWTVDWYAYSVLPASDGVHLIRRGPWAKTLSDEAFTFFARGRQLRSYKVGDLVDTKAFLDKSVSHFKWEKSMELDEGARTLTVATLSREKYVFDYTTGEMRSSKRPLRAVLAAVIASLVFIALMVLRWRRGLANAKS